MCTRVTEGIRSVYTLTPSYKHFHLPLFCQMANCSTTLANERLSLVTLCIRKCVRMSVCDCWVCVWMHGVVLGSGTAVLELWLLLWCVLLHGAYLFVCEVARCLEALLVVTHNLFRWMTAQQCPKLVPTREMVDFLENKAAELLVYLCMKNIYTELQLSVKSSTIWWIAIKFGIDIVPRRWSSRQAEVFTYPV